MGLKLANMAILALAAVGGALAAARETFRNNRPDYYIISSRQGRTVDALAHCVPHCFRHDGDIDTVRIHTRFQP